MKLYYAPGACSLASHIALYETDLPFQIDKFNVPAKKTESGEDFLNINPKGYVPTIQMNDGNILTEGAAILQYIADQKPDSGLAPRAGTLERYRLQEWLTYIGTEIHKSFSPLFNKDAAAEVKNYARDLLGKRLGYVETQLTQHPYLMGNSFTVADAYLFVVMSWSSHVGFDLGPYSNIKAYMARIVMRPSVQAAMKAEGLIQ
jgi:glutathione S-transferase